MGSVVNCVMGSHVVLSVSSGGVSVDWSAIKLSP